MADTRRRTASTPRSHSDGPIELASTDLDKVAAGFAGGFDEVVITVRKDSGDSLARNGNDLRAKGTVVSTGR